MTGIQETPPADWQEIKIDDLFTFRLPGGFTKRESLASERPAGEYYNASTRVTFEWRPIVLTTFRDRRQTWMRDYEEIISRIRGRRANIRTYWENKKGDRVYHAELNVGNWELGEVDLHMAVESIDSASPEIAKQIFRSISFPNPIPERAPEVLFTSR